MGAVTVNMLVAPYGPEAPFKRQARVARAEPDRNCVWLSFPGSGRIPKPYDLNRFARWLEDDRLISVTDKPLGTALALEEASERTRELCDEAWERLAPIRDDLDAFFDERKRAATVRAAAKEAGVDLATMYRTIAKFFEHGQNKLALMPRYVCKHAGANQPEGQKRRGRPPREKPPAGEQAFVFSDEARDQIIELLMSSERFATFEDLYGAVTYRHFMREVGGERVPLPLHQTPTRSQIRHLVRQIDKGFAFTRRQLGNEYQLTLRPLAGGGRKVAFGPGYEYQIDATGSQVELVSVFDRTKAIGRPIIYFVVDVKTSVIAGFHVTIDAASWESARFALFNAFMPKADFCRRLGLDIEEKEWPVSGLPIRIIGDRGELIGEQAERIVEDTLNCELINARTRRGDDKAYVERMFRSIKRGMLESIKGWGPKNRSRNGSNPRSRACLNLYEFTRLVAKFCLYWNHKRLAVGAIPDEILGDPSAKATPIGVWNWGLRNQSGRLRQVDGELLYRHLLPQADAKLHADGIHFKGGVYSTPDLDVMGLRTRARRDGAFPVTVHFDQARADHLWLWWAPQRRLLECIRTDVTGDRDRWFFNDSELACDAKVEKRSKESTRSEQLRTDLEHSRRAIVDAATAEKKQAGRTQSTSTQRVRRNRAAERQFDRERNRTNAGDTISATRNQKRRQSQGAIPNKALERFMSAITSK